MMKLKLKTHPNDFVGHPFDPNSFNCWTLIESCYSNVPTIAVVLDKAKDIVNENIETYVELTEPIDGCIALMGESHIGIYYNRGIYHADKPRVKWDRIAQINMTYGIIKYYDLKDSDGIY